MAQECLHSCCSHDSGTPLATSTLLAEQIMGLREVSTWSSPLDPSVPDSGYLRNRNSLHNGPTHVSGACVGLFASHWNGPPRFQWSSNLTCGAGPQDLRTSAWGYLSSASTCTSRSLGGQGTSLSSELRPSYFFPSRLLSWPLHYL